MEEVVLAINRIRMGGFVYKKTARRRFIACRVCYWASCKADMGSVTNWYSPSENQETPALLSEFTTSTVSLGPPLFKVTMLPGAI